MITLITKDKFNIILNTDTGKYLSFFYDKCDEVTNNIDWDYIEKIFDNSYEFKDEYLRVLNSDEVINNKLNKMNYLVFHTSDACNMNCKYCYAVDNLVDNKSNFLSSETMIKAIDKFYDGDDFFVLFHGREPLTNYKNILEVLKYYKDYKNIHFVLQTNGMLLTEKRINELYKYRCSINISVDGISDYHNVLRINGNDIDYTNQMLNLIKKYKISPIIIIHKNNYTDLCNITNFLIENNVNSASYNFLWPTGSNIELNDYVVSPIELFNSMKEVFDNSIKDNKFIFKERELYLLYGKILKRDLYNYMCNQAPCGAGKNCISIYHDGSVYPCTMVNLQEENYLGTLDDSVDELLNKDVIIKNRDINLIDDCKDCPLRVFCKGGGCSGFIYNLSGNVNDKSLYCEYYYNIIIYIMRKIQLMSKAKYFVNY